MTTPNPTAEPLKSWEVNNNAWEAFAAEEHMTNGIQAAYEAGLRAHGLLSEGAPSEERVEAATWALIDWDTDVVDRGVRDEHYRERRAEVERIAPILAAGVAPQGRSVQEYESKIADLVYENAELKKHLPAPSPAREKLIAEAETLVRRGAASGNPVAEFGVTKETAFVRGVRWAADALAAQPALDRMKVADKLQEAATEVGLVLSSVIMHQAAALCEAAKRGELS